MQPLISIIIPVFNVEVDYLKYCIDSITCGGGYKLKYEIIIIDDGSTNGCAEFCDSLYEENIKVIHQENAGVAVARNTGLKAVKGEYVTFVDPDDFMDSNYQEKIATVFDKGNFDIAYFSYCDYNEGQKKSRQQYTTEKFWTSNNSYECIMSGLNAILPGGSNLFVTVWAAVYRMSFLKENNIYFIERLRKVQDLLFNLYAIQSAGKIVYSPESIYCYRYNSESICHKYNPKLFNLYSYVVQELYIWAEKYYPDDCRILDAIGNWKLFFTSDMVKLNILNSDTVSTKEKKCFLHEIVLSKYFSKPTHLSRVQYYKNLNKMSKVRMHIVYMDKVSILMAWSRAENIRRMMSK